ncbi:MAG: gliding motility lipoprotein GldH [Bacteroidales bacterium]|jgi:gliding motility-associated lipoprotein GldH|nr:hypothetical protein [Lentimicrobiaceae bacterium]MDG1136444.1 gliding motility lipoprotein GldH [Bacteroidales bacterium]MDG2081974.1 gliding motility lipoprotein GldH [Bacteroidales bacterium]|tara:strand:- start:990 stop:1448 length:459 start_codon:yes stop_codon:yes gene_type:complete
MRNILIVLMAVIVISGCDNKVVYKKYHVLENMNWSRFDDQVFDINVTKNIPLDLYLSLRHHTDMPYNYLDVNITMETPNGEFRSKDYHFSLKDSNNKWKGSGMGELWDLDLTIRKDISFRKDGICKVTIENKMPRGNIPGIIELGIIVKESN